MRGLNIGLVDLDTSHPGSWLPVLRAMGHRVVGVYDSGTVYPEGYARKFADTHGIERVFPSLEAMAECVDVAIIHSCNWDVHIDRARPFVEAGKSLFIDKPMAGHVGDIRQLLEWERQGVRITGGSSLRYCLEAAEWLQTHEAGDIVYAAAGCSVDTFNYGIHAYALLQGLLGPGMLAVRHLGGGVQQQVRIEWKDGRTGIVSVGATTGHLPFYATVVTGKDVSHIQVDHRRLYARMLPKVLPFLAGEAEAPIALAELAEIELAALAARRSMLSGGARVELDELERLERLAAERGDADIDGGYDGAAFAGEYRRQKLQP